MAVLHDSGNPPENEGERRVIAALRDGLPDTWHVCPNLNVRQGARVFECDCLVISPGGWAYMVEVKEWIGRIRGNDHEWELPSLVGGLPAYRPNPVPITHKKAQVTKTIVQRADPQLASELFVEPLVTLVSEDPPELTGNRWADKVALVADLLATVTQNPRPNRPGPTSSDFAARVAGIVMDSSEGLAPPDRAGTWRLVELVDSGPTWELWTATSAAGGDHSPKVRLKKYDLDPYATGPRAVELRTRAQQELMALNRLNGAAGAAPLLGAVEEVDGSYLVVTPWPDGTSLASIIHEGFWDVAAAEEVYKQLLHALASVHAEGVVHRNLNPAAAHYLGNGRIQLYDFDFAHLSGSSRVTEFIQEDLDTTYAAPEVRADPGRASKASDVWSAARIALYLFKCDEGSNWTTIPGHLHGVLRRSLDATPDRRPTDAEQCLVELNQPIPMSLFGDFEVNDEINSRFVVRARIADGGIGNVYRVFDGVMLVEWAAKFVKREYADQVNPKSEFDVLAGTPDHPGIVKPQFVEQSTSLRRAGQVLPSESALFLLSPWIDGVRLDTLVSQQLPVARAIDIVRQLGAALGHLHAHGLVHRDVKPQNVMVASDGTVKLVDFNVSADIAETSDTTTGTVPYRPADFGQWTMDCDTYAATVVLAELLAGKPLGASAGDWVTEHHSTLRPAGLAEILSKGLGESSHRFATGDDLATALSQLSIVAWSQAEAAPPQLPSDELRPNWNGYQAQLRRLFSQSEVSNAGTRGLDDFGTWAYVPTRLDEELGPDILSGRFSLVIITGNAGDGKTAFIQMLERSLSVVGRVVSREHGNGIIATLPDLTITTNWDGSQDEGDLDNDVVLSRFFAPFKGSEPHAQPGASRVIAINEGRLLDFLIAHEEDYPWLYREVRTLLQGASVPTADWLTLVNLNQRALTAPTEAGVDGLAGRILDRLADARLWEACDGCTAIELCYARSNAETLRHPILGPRVKERVRQTFDLVRLRRKLHITMRDLRSALAFLLVGSKSCDEIVQMVEDGDQKALLAGYAYNSLFGASEILEPPARSDAATRDRLLALVAQVDVAKGTAPEDDRRFWVQGESALPSEPAEILRHDRDLIAGLRRRLPMDPRELRHPQAVADVRFLRASLRRKAFLEREDPGWISMFPLRRVADFLRKLDACNSSDLAELASSISLSEGIFATSITDEQLAVRVVGDTELLDRSFVVHPLVAFRLGPAKDQVVEKYVEFSPDRLQLEHREHSDIRLDIDLDLHEMLARVKEGFTPSREEMRGAWLNLRLFKERVARLPSDVLLLTDQHGHVFELRRQGVALAVRGVIA